ncbi:MAG: hypothetical protein EOP84_14075 [Verrucomicrobiaceae bacterium]|nr:MAG: hypothetical protein EOP84_14075 [Verrucomicrobiaceae bacterium]
MVRTVRRHRLIRKNPEPFKIAIPLKKQGFSLYQARLWLSQRKDLPGLYFEDDNSTVHHQFEFLFSDHVAAMAFKLHWA